MYYLRRASQSLCITLGLLVILLSACGQPVSSKPSSAPSQAHTAVSSVSPTSTLITPTPTTKSAEETQTCPAPGTARVAMMPPLPSSNHPNLVYSSTSNAINVPYDPTTLLRYDTVTASTTTIVTGNIQQSSISPDGQWLLLTIKVQNQWAIQLIRTDGQHLQTLHCAPGFYRLLFSPDQRSLAFVQTNIDPASAGKFETIVGTLKLLDLTTGRVQTFPSSPDNLFFSPDQRSLVFAEGNDLDVLDLTTGKYHAVLSSQQPGYPESTIQPPITQSSLSPFSSHTLATAYTQAQQFRPSPSSGWTEIRPLKWTGAKGLFLMLARQGSPGGIYRLYLLPDINKDASQQQSNLQYIASNNDAHYRCDNFVMTPDNQQLVCSNSPFMGERVPATITIRPVTGGPFHTIYRGPVGYVETSVISNSTLLIDQWSVDHPDTLWKINTDGNGLVQLMVAPTTDWKIQSSIISNGSLYAFTTSSSNSPETLVFGSLAGGTPKTIIAPQGTSLGLIG